MAEYLASIYGTEKDKVNCSFYFKTGACRHGDSCSRMHNKPTFSQTILLKNLYMNSRNLPLTADGSHTSVQDEELNKYFEEFYEEIYCELDDKYGPIEQLKVCDNLGDHLVGNVYVMFESEEMAEKAVTELNNRWFEGRPIYAELSPVTDFREACCRQYTEAVCQKSGFCNFMHPKEISRDLRRVLNSRSKRRRRSPTPDQRRRNHDHRGDRSPRGRDYPRERCPSSQRRRH